MRRAATAAVGGIGVIALVWAAIAFADDVQCKAGKKCKGTEFEDTITGSQR